MRTLHLLRPLWMSAFAAPAFLAGCGGSDDTPAPPPPPPPTVSARTVYTTDNGASANHVLAFRSSATDGSLTPLGSYETGGNGLGPVEVSGVTPQDGVDVLASQGSLVMSDDKKLLFTVNAGSGTITSFTIAADGSLTRADSLSSGGLQPNALSFSHGLLYVSNVGSAANSFASNVKGFAVTADGKLSAIAGATYSLSTASAQPSGVQFNAAGTLLAVSEISTGKISVFPVNSAGTLAAPTVNDSAGGAPFGASFTPTGQLLVTEVMNRSVSSYSANSAGALTTISSKVVNGQMAVCWTILSPDASTLYTSNSGSGTLSSYTVGTDGTLTLKAAVASTLQGAGSGNIDGGVTSDGQYLYVMDGAIGTISTLHVGSDGTLTTLAATTGSGLPMLGGEGLVVR